MIRIQCNYRQDEWADMMWQSQLILNISKQKTTQLSPLNLLVGIEAATPLIRYLVRDAALDSSHSNREAQREMHRQRASERLARNQQQQDMTVNAGRKTPQTFETNSLVFVIKQVQSTGKLDSGMRGPYRVVKALPHDRYELQLLTGSYGKSTQAAAQFMKPWRGEWTPETCAAYFEDADSDNDRAESTPEQVASCDVQPPNEGTTEPMPSTSRTAEPLQIQSEENEDVLQSGEAVLGEE